MLRDKLMITPLLAGALTACAATGLSVGPQAAESLEAIRQAEELGAENEPEAAFYLNLARKDMELAGRLDDGGNSGDALMVLERAEADASLASAVLLASMMRGRAAQALEQVRALGETEDRSSAPVVEIRHTGGL